MQLGDIASDGGSDGSNGKPDVQLVDSNINSRPKRRRNCPISLIDVKKRFNQGTFTLEKYHAANEFIKSSRGWTLTVSDKISIVALVSQLKYESEERKKKEGQQGKRKGRPKKTINPVEECAKILRRDYKTCLGVWKEYLENKSFTIATSGNRTNHRPRIRVTRKLKQSIFDFVTKRKARFAHITARIIVNHLVDHCFLKVNVRNSKEMDTACRLVCRLMRRLGYTQKSSNNKCFSLKKDIIRSRDEYVSSVLKAIETKRRIVYMDESYIHHHYNKRPKEWSSSHTEKHTSYERAKRHKGQRYCFIAAIISDDPNHYQPFTNINNDDAIIEKYKLYRRKEKAAIMAEPPGVLNVKRAFVIPESIDIFQGGPKPKKAPVGKYNLNLFEGKNDTVDYHSMFDGDYFVQWMKILLQSLKDHNIENTIIVMDNAKYHKCLPNDIPKPGWKKQEIINWCLKNGVSVHERDCKQVLMKNVSLKVGHVEPTIVSMAKEAGHEVMFSPPHYSDLQPIETVWAVLKKKVGDQYNVETKLKDVRTRLVEEFDALESFTIQGCINRSVLKLYDLYKTVTLEEEEDDENDEKNGDSDFETPDEEHDETDTDIDERYHECIDEFNDISLIDSDIINKTA